MKRQFVTILNGAMSDMIGEISQTSDNEYILILIKGRIFKFKDGDFRPSTFEELVDKFVKNQKLLFVDFSEGLTQTFENGFKLSVGENSDVVLYDSEGESIITKKSKSMV